MKQNATLRLVLCTLLFAIVCTNTTSAQLMVNEVSSRNATMYKEGNKDYEDFIEIFNNTGAAVNLNDYYLSTTRTNPTKWRFFNQTLNAGAYMVVFADNEDAYGYSRYTDCYCFFDYQHTNFKISMSGETVYLFNLTGQIVDSLVSGKNLDVNQSVGKALGSNIGQVFFNQMTPNAANTTTGYSLRAGNVTFSKVGAKYAMGAVPVNVNATCPIGQTVLYTTNCNTPVDGIANPMPSIGLTFDTTTVVRTRCVGVGMLPGLSKTETFIFNDNTTLAVIAISTDSANLWDPAIGILSEGLNPTTWQGANYFKEWRRASKVEFFDATGVKRFNKDAAINTDGNSSIAAPKKSLRVNFNHSTLGDSRLAYEMFPSSRPGLASFKNIKVRAGGNVYVASQYGGGVIFHDGAVQTFAKNLNVSFAAYRPAVFYLNGKYWGMYEIRERLDAALYKNNLGVNEDSIATFDKQGWDWGTENARYDAISTQVSTDPAVNTDAYYNYFSSNFDIKNFYDYMTTEIHLQNGDWIGPYGYVNNLVLWRDYSAASDNKYRFSLKDFDVSYCISYNGNYVEGVLNTPSTNPLPSMFKKLVLNDKFKKEFANRYADVVNFYFNKDTLRNKIINYNTEVQGEIADECARWPTNSPATWDYRYQNMLTCMDSRNITGLDHIDATLLGTQGKSTVTLTAQPLDGGKIQFSTIRPNLPWTGTYFKGNEVPFCAVPAPGYEFSHWITDNGIIRPEDLTKMALDTFFSSNTNLTAVFTLVNTTLSNKLLSFTTTAKECNVTGNWEMDTDEEIVSYEVQKKSSFDKEFRTISKTDAKQVTQPVSYSFADVATGNFEQYRLKITDVQGKVTYSNITVARTNCTNFAAQIQTNPVVDELVLNISNKNTAKQVAVVNIFNTNGATVATTRVSISGNGTISMPANNLSGGMYAVRVTVGNESAVLRFLKK
jgi:hypothetical protein